MPTPANRTPLRVARGTYSNLNSSVADIQEGEICYATDQDKLYVKEGSALVSTQAALPATNAVTDAAQTFTKAQRGDVIDVTGATPSLDLNLGNNWRFTTSANWSSFTVSNLVEGQTGSIFIVYGGTHTGGFASQFRFVGGAAGIGNLTSTSGKIDRIDYIVLDSSTITCTITKDYVA